MNFSSAFCSFFEHLFTWKGRLKKFVKWTDFNDLKIVKIEGCSYREAGFSFWQTSRNSTCAKLEVVDLKGEHKGLYLMAYDFIDGGLSKSRFVELAEIEFNNPYEIVSGKSAALVLKKIEN